MTTQNITRRRFLELIGATTISTALTGCTELGVSGIKSKSGKKPNFIIIYCDDLGYGDLACYGSEKHRTPNIDQMADEGTRFTSFYVTSGVCTPSRSSLMTGCYPRRVNMHFSDRNEHVLFPVARKGLNPEEITIADVLKQQGYATACIGKWHLGDQLLFLPTRQGFDYYYGIPYSNDMMASQRRTNPPLPLLRNETVIEAPVDQNTLTKRYTEETIKFIEDNKNKPFFVYLPHAMTHDPVHASEQFRDKSANGRYGDAVEELDWSTGQILQKLKELNLDNNTLVVFTSDNGAENRFGGSNAPLRGIKNSTWEGGMREPCVIRWPGKIPAGHTCDEVICNMDFLPTFARLAGTTEPQDRIIDGRNIWPLLSGQKDAKSPHEAFYYYLQDQLQAVRSGKWKLHLPLETKKTNYRTMRNFQVQLYDLDADISETNNLADKHPEVVERLTALAQKAREDLGDMRAEGKGQRPAGWVEQARPLLLQESNV